MSDGIWTKVRNALAVEALKRSGIPEAMQESTHRKQAVYGQRFPYSPETLDEMQAKEAEDVIGGAGHTIGAIKPGVPYANLRKQLLGADITEMSPVQYGKHLANIRPRTNADSTRWDTRLLGAHAEDIYGTDNPWEVVDRHIRTRGGDPSKVARGTLLDTPNNENTGGIYYSNPRGWTSPEKGTILLREDPEKMGLSGPGVAMHEGEHAVDYQGPMSLFERMVDMRGVGGDMVAARYLKNKGAFTVREEPVNPFDPKYLAKLKNQSRLADAYQHTKIVNTRHHQKYDYMEHDAPYINTLKSHILRGGEVDRDALNSNLVLQEALDNYRAPIRPTSTGNATPAPVPVPDNLWKILAGAGLAGGAAMGGVSELKKRPKFWEQLSPTAHEEDK